MTHPASFNATAPNWSRAEDAVLRAAIDEGKHIGQIIPLLPRRTRYSIHHRAKRLNLNLLMSEADAAREVSAELANEILRLCGYIKSDGYIASYIGCSRELVGKIRARLPGERTSAGCNDLDGPPLPAREDMTAKTGSVALYNAMVRHFSALASSAGTTAEIAMLACLYGRDRAARFTTQKGIRHV